MGFDVVSAVVARPFLTGPWRSAEVARAWVRVASMHEDEIADRMAAAVTSEGQRGRFPVTAKSGRVGVRQSSMSGRILSVLASRVGGLSVGEIAQAIGVARIKVISVATKDLQLRGLVKRGNGSGAGVFVMMTDKGRSVLAECKRLEAGQ